MNPVPATTWLTMTRDYSVADLTLRDVEPEDLDLICRHRHEMFRASGRRDDDLGPMAEPFAEWLRPRLVAGLYFGWIAEVDGQAVGGLGMMVIDWPPHPSHPDQDVRGYILNVYVEPDHRGRGIARMLMDRAMAQAKRRGLRHLILHATAMGRPMYERLGWRQTSEMSISLVP